MFEGLFIHISYAHFYNNEMFVPVFADVVYCSPAALLCDTEQVLYLSSVYALRGGIKQYMNMHFLTTLASSQDSHQHLCMKGSF